MKKLVISALAASMASATALASESEWASLDRDVQALSASLSGLEASAIKFSGYIRTAYYSENNDPPAADTGDFAILNARLKAEGTRGDIGYVLQVGFEDAGTAGLLKDAYVNIPVGENLKVRAGQFKGIIARDSLVSASRLFFANRSEIGDLFSSRREGIALMGTFDTFDWAVTVQDGTDLGADDYLIALRGEIDFLGDGVDPVEGAYGAPEEIEGTAGVSYWDDGFLNDGNGFLFQGTLASNMYSVNVWVADLGRDLVTSNGAATYLMADTTPYGVMGTFMLTQPTAEQGGWELGARFQDADDLMNTNIIDLGVNYYGSGHDYKYFLQYRNIDSDDLAVDGDAFLLGLNLGF